jgi:MtrB/PioB family decaheme-associated outer membrane protein
MGRRNTWLTIALIFVLSIFFVSPLRAQVDVGDYRVSGSGEIGGLPRSFSGRDAKFEEYRDIPESVIVPELQLMIGAKKEDFYFNFDSSKLGRDDQNYLLRTGRYGLLDLEFEWKQFPHLFSDKVAQSPYSRSNGGGDNFLSFKPTATDATASCATSPICQFLNNHATPVTLSLFNGIGRFNLRYTPNPGWTFTGTYWSNHNVGDRALGAVFASSPGSYIFTEQREPMNYQTHNIELGGEYAANNWSVGLKYNASLFHNGVSTLTWDNPLNLSNASAIDGSVSGPCTDTATWSPASTGRDGNRGPCRGRLDLYPSNQAHTITLTGAASLPLKTHFMGTASYGWRLQNDTFLPATINSALAPLAISDRGLGGNVNPTTVNLSVVNNAIDKLNLKANYRFYDLNDNSRNVTLTGGWYLNDQGTPQDVGDKITRLGYSKNYIGLESAYNFASWLTGKFTYGWERMHRDGGNVLNSNEHTIGPTFDIKPMNGVLLRAVYKHSWRDAPDYNNNRLDPGTDIANISRKFYQAKRDRDRVSLFADVSPWETLGLHAGFEFTGESYPDTTLGTQNDFNFSPSVGFVYAPMDWLRFFGDYNFDLFTWRLDTMQRSDTTQNPNDPATCDANCQLRLWNSRGRDKVHTFSLGSDVDIIKNLLGFRIQYTFSQGLSAVSASGATCVPLAPAAGGCTQASDYPNITNTWHELLARFEYQLHKNVALRFGYYFNKARDKDYGVDIMKPWMGDVIDPQASPTALAQLQRSMFLGDQIKGPFTAHVGFVTLRFRF